MEMEELKRERDVAQSKLDELRKKMGDDLSVRVSLLPKHPHPLANNTLTHAYIVDLQQVN